MKDLRTEKCRCSTSNNPPCSSCESSNFCEKHDIITDPDEPCPECYDEEKEGK